MIKKIYFWSMSSHGLGISGGDRIYIEFAKRWSTSCPITVVTWTEGEAMMARNNLQENQTISFIRLPVPEFIKSNFLLCYLYRIVQSIIKSLTLTLDNSQRVYLYSSSEFWMDSLACWILKVRYPTLKWIATWYQTAPNPLIGFSNGRYRLPALLLWLSQLPIKPLIEWYADFVLVNNELEKKVFPTSRTVVVLGAVDTNPIDTYLAKHPLPKKKYAAVFQGRFHPQKGVVELIDIWKLVVAKHPKAKLAMIGDGPLRPTVEKRIRDLNLKENIDLLGYVFDGPHKYQVFSQSSIAVHPAFFDSGGMATAEAMAFGLPAIGFNLPSFASYYPVGMIKVPIGNLNSFAAEITILLTDDKKREKIGEQARLFIANSYSWDQRAKQVLEELLQ